MKAILHISTITVAFFMLMISLNLRAEGTKELRPASTNWGNIQINDKSRPFAQATNTDSLQRLYFHIESTSEVVYFGMQHAGAGTGTIRIKNPNGVVEFAQRAVPTVNGDSGFINTYNQAVAGPKVGGSPSTGYLPYKFKPSMKGDYYIEFTTSLATAYYLDLFDVSVYSASNRLIKGRLWSYAWDLNTQGSNNSCFSKFFIYTKDKFITQVSMNGIQPFGFVVSSNSTGTGDLVNGNNDNRKSVFGNSTRPEYRVFLNLPDTLCYPIGEIPHITDSLKIINQALVGDTVVFAIRITKPGTIEILLDINNTLGYQSGSEDLYLVKNLDSGLNYIFWDGRNGLGNFVQANTIVKITSSFTSGITHLPIYDPEYNVNGYLVSRLYPLSGTATLYWDDSNLSGGTVNIDGALGGGHAWTNNFGDNRTMNTWWDGYKISQMNKFQFSVASPLPITLTYFDATLKAGIVDITWTCEEEINNDYFTVQRSKDGLNFESVRLIGGTTNSTISITYSTTDNSPYLGVSYYRLKQTDLNGKVSYSNTVMVKNESFEFSLNPNPVYSNGMITLYLGSYVPTEIYISIIKENGEIVYNYKQVPQGSEIAINKDLAPGVYWVNARCYNQMVAKKIIIM